MVNVNILTVEIVNIKTNQIICTQKIPSEFLLSLLLSWGIPFVNSLYKANIKNSNNLTILHF